jgi:hypothetical protein
LIQFLKINGKQKIPLLLESEEFSINKFREWVIEDYIILVNVTKKV